MFAKGQTVKNTQCTYRVRTLHRDGTMTIEAMFYLDKDGNEVPGYVGGKHRVDQNDKQFAAMTTAPASPYTFAWTEHGSLQVAFKGMQYATVFRHKTVDGAGWKVAPFGFGREHSRKFYPTVLEALKSRYKAVVWKAFLAFQDSESKKHLADFVRATQGQATHV